MSSTTYHEGFRPLTMFFNRSASVVYNPLATVILQEEKPLVNLAET